MSRLLLIHRGGSGGIRGSEICLMQSIQALHDAGHEILFARNLPVVDELVGKYVKEILSIEIPEIEINGARSKLPVIAYLKSLIKLLKAIRKFSPELIYSNGGLPCQLAVPAAKISGIPVLCHFHHPMNRRYYYLWLMKFADSLFFPSKFTCNDAGTKAKIAGEVVYAGVDTSRFKPTVRDDSVREAFNIPAGAIVVGQVGQLTQTKRPGMLLHAFSRAVDTIPNLHLCLVGRGPLEDSLKQEVKRLNLTGKVTITGYVEDVLPFYQHIFDINALASSEEGLGISILEGSACGLPSLISNCTGLTETTIDQVTGRTFAPEDENMLVAILVEMASNIPSLKQTGIAARKFIENNFSLQTYRSNIVRITEELIRTRG